MLGNTRLYICQYTKIPRRFLRPVSLAVSHVHGDLISSYDGKWPHQRCVFEDENDTPDPVTQRYLYLVRSLFLPPQIPFASLYSYHPAYHINGEDISKGWYIPP